MANSNLDSLIEALRASGADVDEKFGNKSNSSNANSNGSSKSQSSKSTSSNYAKSSANFTGAAKEIIDLPFFDRFKSLKLKGKLILALIIILILAAAYWWFHPPINIQSETTWIIGAILILLPMFLYFKSKKIKYKLKSDDAESTITEAENSFSKDMIEKTNNNKVAKYKKLGMIPVIIAAIGIFGMLVSASFWPGNAQKYADILKTDTLDFNNDIPEVNYNQIPVIDRDTARVLGTKEMGSIPDYVSQFEISDLYSQINFHQKPVRVSCLMYADLFKWLTNRNEGIPAYCIIDMATQDADIVRISDVDGTEGCGIKYSESEPLARNIERYIQLKYPFYMFDEFSFQVDEKGHPWWICPVQAKTIGLFGGKTIKRVVMCDAVSGNCDEMDIEEVPEWADLVYPSNLLLEQFNWSGKYKNGWLNSWIGQSGVVKTTPGKYQSNSSGSKVKSLGYNYVAKNDDVWVYTGVTSATSDTSIIGFILINTRTAESHFYSIAGATEAAAMESAEGQVQHLRYSAAFPILINVANQPTYFIALKDSAGLVKKFAMIDIQRYQNVAIGDTVADCQKAYQALLANNGVDMSNGAISSGEKASGTISNIAQAVVDGNTHFYITLSGDEHIYDIAVPGLIKIVKYKVGDSITLRYSDGGDTCNVTAIE